MRRNLASMLIVSLLLAVAVPAWGAQARTRLVSKTSQGGALNGDSFEGVPSANGRWVAFTSDASNLPGYAGGTDVYVRNLRTNKTKLVSRNSAGEVLDDESSHPSISANGRWIVFESGATNLPGNDLNFDVFIRDMETGKTRLVSQTSGGEPGNSGSTDPVLSTNGRFVAFETDADNFPGDSNELDVFVRDIARNRTRLVSKTTGGDPAEGGPSSDPAISRNGRFVAFESEADNLPGAGATLDDQTYVHDRRTGRTRLVSKTSGGDPADGDSEDPGISGNGRFVGFESEASTNLPGAASYDLVYIHDVEAGKTRLVSKTSGGVPADDASTDPSLNRGGRYVAFESHADNLSAVSDPFWFNVFLHDRRTSRTRLISRTTAGDPAQDGPTFIPSAVNVLTPAGEFIVFSSNADNLPGDDNFERVFIRGPLS